MKIDTNHARTTDLIKLTLFFAAGLITGRAANLTPLAAYTLAAVLLCILLLLLLSKKQAPLAIVTYLFFPIGILLSNGYGNQEFDPHNIARYANGEKIRIEGMVLERNEGKNGTRFSISTEKIILPDKSIPVSGKLRLSIASGAASIVRGDRIRFMAALKRPRNFGNPGGFDYEQFLADRDIYATAFMSDDRYLARTAIGSGPASVFSHLRRKLRKIIDESSGDASGILKALSIGDRSGIDEEVMTVFRKTGVAHILAISGLHMGIAAFFFFSIFKVMLGRSEALLINNLAAKGAALLTFLPLTSYLLMSGMATSAMRAFIMAGAFLLAIIINRESETFNTIAMAALIILVIWPQALFDAAFQLSFTAVIAIVYISPRIEMALFKKGDQAKVHYIRKPISFLIVSAAAIAGTAPLSVHYFMETSLVGILGNIIAIPLIGFITVPLSMVSLVIAPFSSAAAAMVFGLAGNIVLLTTEPLKYLASLSFSSVLLSPPNWFEIILYYLLIWSFLNSKNKTAKTAMILIPSIYMMPLAGEALNAKSRETLSVTFLSVGQGESTVVRFPEGKTMLVDGGGFYNDSFDVGRMVIRPYLLSQGIKNIDYMLMSHPHPDHLSGLLHIMKEFSVGEVWSSGDTATKEKHRSFVKLMKERNIPERTVSGKDPDIEIDGVTVSFLMPDDTMPAKGSSNSEVNNRSVVIRLAYGRHSLLLAGDMEAEAEAILLKRGLNVESDIIKVGHHGSLTSSTPEFIEAVLPDYAVFTVGYNNRFNFPKGEIVKRYIEEGAAVYRTDLDGAISFISDGKSIEVSTFRTSAVK
ncbi:MAG: DNA internalization-related competence protein ComEC/Rec2 [Proteobacteria bacterium]|nr:DNA internalization-related competence protein ComEC/Rec2 [Pseudomonadota bacterium]